MNLHPILAAAAAGELPDWSRAGAKRVEHMRRVADLLGAWSVSFGLTPAEGDRWRAVGLLHDVLREADVEELRLLVSPELASLSPEMVHGPAAAVRLKEEGVEDEPFLLAVAYHTIGHPELDQLGRALYAADFLEPGRKYLSEWRTSLRAGMPDDPHSVVREVARVRISRQLDEHRPLRPETREFWNVLTCEADG